MSHIPSPDEDSGPAPGVERPFIHGLKSDVEAARAALGALDPDRCAKFGYRTFADHGDDPRLALKAFGTLDAGIRQSSNAATNGKPCNPVGLLTFMQTKGAGAFFQPNELDGQGQLRANVVSVRALFVDADSRPEVERLNKFISDSGLTPTLLVASGGIHEGAEKLQSYWRVAGCAVSEFTKSQLTLVSRIGTDPAVQDPGRVMRLPGFWHQKVEPRQTRIVAINRVSYDTTQFSKRVLAQPQIIDPWANGKGSGGTPRTKRSARTSIDIAGTAARLRVLLKKFGGLITPAVRTLIIEAVAPADGQPGSRHATLLTIASRCIRDRWPDNDIRDLVLPVVHLHWGDGDWTMHFTDVLRWVRDREQQQFADGVAWPAGFTSVSGEMQPPAAGDL